MFPTLSRRAKLGLGVLASYTLYESYMYVRTQQLIQERKSLESRRKFASARVSGLFVNPFEEYRPQTAFEFMYVRLVEAVESVYGSRIEVHDLYPSAGGQFARVQDLLKTCRPNYELMRHNSQKLQEEVAGHGDGLASIRNQMLVTWLGQSCSLVQLSGLNILTDPIFSDHLFSEHLGPKRLVRSPMSIADVKFATRDNLNLILVSHNHPDHLELGIVKELGNKPTWVVPMGLKATLAKEGISNVIELDWWQTASLNAPLAAALGGPLEDEYEVVCVPGMHWSGQRVYDANTSLWGSFILRRNGRSILYHAGDTGYAAELFESLGKHYAPVYLSLLPIGQYCPSWHQKPRHVSPAECMTIVEQLKSARMLGVHFGTFKLSSEPILEPKNKLLELAKAAGKTGAIGVPDFGHTYVYDLSEVEEAV